MSKEREERKAKKQERGAIKEDKRSFGKSWTNHKNVVLFVAKNKKIFRSPPDDPHTHPGTHTPHTQIDLFEHESRDLERDDHLIKKRRIKYKKKYGNQMNSKYN